MEDVKKTNGQTTEVPKAPKVKPAKKRAVKKGRVHGSRKTAQVKTTQTSKSGKYRSIHALMDSLFRKNKNLTREAAEKVVKSEYPHKAKRFISNNHFAWYKTQFFTRKIYAKRV